MPKPAIIMAFLALFITGVLENVSASVGDELSMSFHLGECAPHIDWIITKNKPNGDVIKDVFRCYDEKLASSAKFTGRCPQEGQTRTVQLPSVNQSDYGKYCLEIDGTICSCKFLEMKNSSVDSTTKDPGNSQTISTPVVNSTTTDPGNSQTISTPVVNSTTTDPGNSQTISTPVVNSTTTDPGNSQTISTPVVNSTTTDPGNSQTKTLRLVVAPICVFAFVCGVMICVWKRKQICVYIHAHAPGLRKQEESGTSMEMMELNDRPLDQNHLREP